MRLVDVIFFVLVFLFFSSSIIYCQDENINLGKLKLYIEGSGIDYNYLRREVTFVDYVRDRRQADIILLVTRRHSGGGGREYTFRISGRGVFESLADTILYYTKSTDSDEEERIGFVKTLKRALFPFINKTRLANYIDIDYPHDDKDFLKSPSLDPWNYWIFRIEIEGFINGESQRKSYAFGPGINAERTSKNWKTKIFIGFNYQEDNYSYDEEEFTSISRSKYIRIEQIKSLGDHFGAGVFLNYNSSTFRNIEHELDFYPAIEYSFFPYSESSYREITIAYQLGYNWYDYFQETIFGYQKESIYRHRIDFDTELKQEWGEIDIGINYVSDIEDLQRNRFEIRAGFSLNVFEGFQVSISGRYSKIRDQFSIPKTELSLEEILLQRRELQTQYDYWSSVGLSYSFGSIYNNIVNPRF